MGIRVGAAVLAAAVAVPSGVPKEWAGYREWGSLLEEPIQVPYELSVLCAPATREQLDAARKRHGPHNDYLIEVYANPSARAVLEKDDKAPSFPAGAVIAKEKLRFVKPGSMEVDGVAFMVKREGKAFASSGGWEFLFFPKGQASARATHEACARCHQGAAKRDFVFGQYPRRD
jgi:hypothetical protein